MDEEYMKIIEKRIKKLSSINLIDKMDIMLAQIMTDSNIEHIIILTKMKRIFGKKDFHNLFAKDISALMDLCADNVDEEMEILHLIEEEIKKTDRIISKGE